MGALRLTRAAVEAASPALGDRYLWDSLVVGFAVKVTPRGARAYLVQYRARGRTRRLAIGRHGRPWTVETARDKARLILAQVGQGRDPQGERMARRRDMSVAELGELYLAEAIPHHSRSARLCARGLIANHIVPILGRMAVSQLTSAEADRLLREVAAGKTACVRPRAGASAVKVQGGRAAANAAVTTLSAMLGFAVRRGVRSDHPTRRTPRFRQPRRGRPLSPDEYARLGQALAAASALGAPNPQALNAIALICLTGQGVGEILGLTWGQVDLQAARLALTDARGRRRLAPIAAPAVALIAALPRRGRGERVFVGRGGDGGLSELTWTWTRIAAAAGLEGVRLQDLRYSFGGLGVGAGESLPVVGALMGYRTASSTERLASLAEAPVKAAADRISAQVARLMGFEIPEPALTEALAEGERSRRALAEAAATPWIRVEEAARLTGLTPGTLQLYRTTGDGPSYRKLRYLVVYRRDEVVAWVAARGKRSKAGRPRKRALAGPGTAG